MTAIIAIQGGPNSGKTTTLWYVYMYLTRCASAVRFFLNEGNNYVEKDIAPNEIVYNESQQAIDFRAVLTIRHNIYVITSQGDEDSSVKSGLNWALRFTPTAIICASRWHGKTSAKKALEEYLNIFPSLSLYTAAYNYNEEDNRKAIKAKEMENTQKIIDLIFDKTSKNIDSYNELAKEAISKI